MHAHTYKCVHTYARRWLELCGAKHGHMHAHTHKHTHTHTHTNKQTNKHTCARRWLELCGAKHGRSSQTAGAAAAAVSAFMDVERDA